MSRYNPGDLVSGKYRIVRLIGDGGMGVVYEARHEVLGSSVALKFLHADLAKRPGLTQRFLQEARVSATIQSAHVTHVTDVDTDQDGSPYLVMELLSGQSLQALMDQLGRLPLDQTVDFSLQILAGLEAAHALGVVHRDMKPDNVFVTPTGGGPLLKLIDFGIAKLRASSEYTKGLTRAGVVMGTPEYMAPEQLVSAHTTDLRADIYSVGVMMFEMLAGCRPADGDDAEVIIAAVEGGRVRRLKQLMPELPDGLVALIERAMLPNRDQRFESASAMRLSLAPFAGHLSHAGRLAATAEPLAPLPTPMSSVLLSLPQSSAPPPAGSSPPPSALGVPRTLPPDGPPLSVSQLGAARTSLSEAFPVMSPLPAATAMGGPAFPPYSPSGLPAPSAPAPARSGRSGILISLLVLAVVAGGGAVGYAAYRAADDRRVVVPPLPDVTIAPTGTLRVEPLNPDVRPELPRTPTPTPGTKSPSGAKPGPPTPADTGVNNPGQVVVGSGGRSSTIQLPFPIPSTIQIPTALPSGIQLPPGIAFPPGFPGIPQQPPTPAPTASPAPTNPPATTPPPTTTPPTPPATETPKRPIPSTKP